MMMIVESSNLVSDMPHPQMEIDGAGTPTSPSTVPSPLPFLLPALPHPGLKEGLVTGVLEGYQQEIRDNMYSNERETRVAYSPNLRYLKYRRILVDWLSEIGDGFGLHNVCVQTAVSYLDRILSVYPFRNGNLQLVAIGCLLVAAKYEEREEFVPSLQDLSNASNNAYTLPMIAAMEATLLDKLEWRLRVATPAHFLGLYSHCSVAPTDCMQGKPVPVDRLRKYVAKYSGFYSDLCLQEGSFLPFLPSIIASASLLTSRRTLYITPVWPESLRLATGYTEEDLLACTELIASAYAANFSQPIHELSPTSALQHPDF